MKPSKPMLTIIFFVMIIGKKHLPLVFLLWAICHHEEVVAQHSTFIDVPACTWDPDITYICNDAFNKLHADHKTRKSMDVALVGEYLLRLEAAQEIREQVVMDHMNAKEYDMTIKHIEDAWYGDTPLCEWEPDIENICNDVFNALPADHETRYTILITMIKTYLQEIKTKPEVDVNTFVNDVNVCDSPIK